MRFLWRTGPATFFLLTAGFANAASVGVCNLLPDTSGLESNIPAGAATWRFDLTMSCTIAPGTALIRGDIRLDFNVPVTSRVTAGVPEYVTIVGEPAPSAQVVATGSTPAANANIFPGASLGSSSIHFANVPFVGGTSATPAAQNYHFANVRLDGSALDPGAKVTVMVTVTLPGTSTMTIAQPLIGLAVSAPPPTLTITPGIIPPMAPSSSAIVGRIATERDGAGDGNVLSARIAFAERQAGTFWPNRMVPIGAQNMPGYPFQSHSGFLVNGIGAGQADSGTQFFFNFQSPDSVTSPGSFQLSVPSSIGRPGSLSATLNVPATAIDPATGLYTLQFVNGQGSAVYEVTDTNGFIPQTLEVPVRLTGTWPAQDITVSVGIGPTVQDAPTAIPRYKFTPIMGTLFTANPTPPPSILSIRPAGVDYSVVQPGLFAPDSRVRVKWNYSILSGGMYPFGLQYVDSSGQLFSPTLYDQRGSHFHFTLSADTALGQGTAQISSNGRSGISMLGIVPYSPRAMAEKARALEADDLMAAARISVNNPAQPGSPISFRVTGVGSMDNLSNWNLFFGGKPAQILDYQSNNGVGTVTAMIDPGAAQDCNASVWWGFNGSTTYYSDWLKIPISASGPCPYREFTPTLMSTLSASKTGFLSGSLSFNFINSINWATRQQAPQNYVEGSFGYFPDVTYRMSKPALGSCLQFRYNAGDPLPTGPAPVLPGAVLNVASGVGSVTLQPEPGGSYIGSIASGVTIPNGPFTFAINNGLGSPAVTAYSATGVLTAPQYVTTIMLPAITSSIEAIIAGNDANINLDVFTVPNSAFEVQVTGTSQAADGSASGFICAASTTDGKITIPGAVSGSMLPSALDNDLGIYLGSLEIVVQQTQPSIVNLGTVTGAGVSTQFGASIYNVQYGPPSVVSGAQKPVGRVRTALPPWSQRPRMGWLIS